MKQLITKFALAVIALCFNFIYLQAQEASKTFVPRWVSDKGYWVIETNGDSPANHIIHFYNNDNTLVYKESLTRTKFKPARKKIKMKLKKILETSVSNWEAKSTGMENTNLVAKALK